MVVDYAELGANELFLSRDEVLELIDVAGIPAEAVEENDAVVAVDFGFVPTIWVMSDIPGVLKISAFMPPIPEGASAESALAAANYLSLNLILARFDVFETEEGDPPLAMAATAFFYYGSEPISAVVFSEFLARFAFILAIAIPAEGAA